MTSIDRKELAARIHDLNKKWWQDPATGEPIQRDPEELLALIVSELAESLEGDRKNLMDDHLPHRKMAEVELADAAIRIYDMAGGFGVRMTPRSPWLPPPNTKHSKFIMDAVRSVGSKEPMSNILNETLDMIEGYCGMKQWDLAGAIEDKLAYNQTRIDHSHAARLAEGGKKY